MILDWLLTGSLLIGLILYVLAVVIISALALARDARAVRNNWRR